MNAEKNSSEFFVHKTVWRALYHLVFQNIFHLHKMNFTLLHYASFHIMMYYLPIILRSHSVSVAGNYILCAESCCYTLVCFLLFR